MVECAGEVSVKPDLQNNGAILAGEANRNEDFVEVPNTEFVALIVGRNGHKIKVRRGEAVNEVHFLESASHNKFLS